MTYFGSTDPENVCEKQGIIARAEYTRVSGSFSDSLGMFTLTGNNLYDSQGNLNKPDMWFPCLISSTDHGISDTNKKYCTGDTPLEKTNLTNRWRAIKYDILSY